MHASLHSRHAAPVTSGRRQHVEPPVGRHHTCRHRPHVTCTAQHTPSDSGPEPPSPTLVAARQKLEALLEEEGIELASSSTPSTVQFSSPRIDWSRFNVQVLFVDRTDTLRARIAAGIFDRIAAWNGFGRSMISWSCGLEAAPPDHSTQPTASASASHLPFSQALSDLARLTSAQAAKEELSASKAARAAAVMSAAANLKLGLNELTRPAEQFEIEDLDRYDLVLCLDRGIHDAIMRQLDAKDKEYYEEKVCLLSSFSRYEGDFVLLARGGFALLPMQLSFLLKTGPKALSVVKLEDDIISPQLSTAEGVDQWNDMVQALICCTAGLAKYLMDAQPEYLHWNDEL